jgi:hypothetical protein
MTRKGLRYMNALAIVSVVFISISVIPIGVLAGIAFSNGEVKDDQTLFLAANESFVLTETSSYKLYFVNYWVQGYPRDIHANIYIMDDLDFAIWNYTDLPPTYIKAYSDHDRFLYANDVYGYIVFINPNNFDITIKYTSVEISDFTIPWMVFGSIFALFFTILVFNTIGYFIKAFIVIPITGSPYRDTRRRDYRYEKPARPARAAPAAPVAPVAPTDKAKPPTPPKAPKPVAPFAPREPAINAISESYVVAGQAKAYHPTNKFVSGLERAWDHTAIAQRILAILALFFFVLGLIVTSWFMIFGLPLTLIGIAVILFFTGRNRREELVKVVESYKAIYIHDAARLLRTAPEVIRNDAWKIVRLGLGPIGFDAEKNILFDMTKVDPSKKKELSPAAQTIHTQLVSEVEKKEEKKEEKVVPQEEIKCPFCEAENPPDSSFCIACGASLKPAK